MGLFNLLTGDSVLMVGVEDDPEGGIRVYINARYLGQYVLCTNPDDINRVRNAWGSTAQHVFMPTPPPEMVFQDERARIQGES